MLRGTVMVLDTYTVIVLGFCIAFAIDCKFRELNDKLSEILEILEKLDKRGKGDI